MNPAQFDRLQAMFSSTQKEIARLQEESKESHHVYASIIEGLTQGLISRSDHHVELRFDTATTNREEKFDIVRLTGGFVGRKIRVLSAGGGNLQMKLPDMPDFVDIAATGVNATWDDDFFTEVILRATTGAAGTARLRVGAYTGKEATQIYRK